MRFILIVLCFGLISGGALAQAGPGTGFYARIRMAGVEAPVEYRSTGPRARTDIMVGGIMQTYISDREKGVLIHLSAAGNRRTALLFPLDRGEALLPLPLTLEHLQARATLKPIGSSLIAGQSCRLLEFSAYLNQSGVACVNADGVILQMTQKGRNAPLYQVVAYTKGAQDAKWFVIPPDYQTLALPGMGGAAGNAMPAPVP